MGSTFSQLIVDNLPIIVLGVLGVYLVRAFWPSPPAPAQPQTCPNCRGTTTVRAFNKHLGREEDVPCSVCHAVGRLASVQHFKYDKWERCACCDAGYTVEVPPESCYPDGSPMPGARYTVVGCDACNATGWMHQKNTPGFHSARPIIYPDAMLPSSADDLDEDAPSSST